MQAERHAAPSRTLSRAQLRALFRLLFRVRVDGLEYLQAISGGRLVVANHVSWLDGLLLYLFLPGDYTFAINLATSRRRWVRPWLGWFEHLVMDTTSPAALKAAVRLLGEGGRLVLFPEARLTTTGTLMKVYDGAAFIAERADVPLVPVAIRGAEHLRCNALAGLQRRRWLPRLGLRILPPRALDLTAQASGPARRAAAANALARLLREVAYAAVDPEPSLFAALAGAATRHGRGRVVLEDHTGARLNYGDLLTRAFILGARLARRSVAGERIGILLPSTAASVVCLFACFARGRQAAMLNFTAGERGLVTAQETAGIRLVVTSRAFIEGAGLAREAAALAAVTQVLYLEDLRAEIGLASKLAGALAGRLPRLAHRLLGGARGAGEVAVILFTSGSEGIPKGVALSHANLLANYAQVQMLIDLTCRDRVLNVLPTFHAFGLLGGVLLPLFKGTPSYQYPSPLHYRVIPELCYSLGISCLFGTTTFLRGYARHADGHDFHRLRYVIAGAEKLTDDVRQLWAERFGIRIFEGYGATEGSPVLAVNFPLAQRRGTVGQLVPMLEHYLEPVAGIAEGGELVVKGPNVMLGYLFHGSDGQIIPPWTQRGGAGWYATGDIVSVDAEGYVTIRGRAKRFAKIGGEMVSLATVEELAAGLWPEALHAALAVNDPRKGEQVVLFTNQPGAERADLVAAARAATVSELAIPRQVVTVGELPLLGSGKVDYPALRERWNRG